MKTPKRKKVIIYPEDIVIDIIAILLFVCACIVGYVIGIGDGYTEGYIHGTTGQYTSQPDHLALPNLAEYGQSLINSAEYYINEVSENEQIEKRNSSVIIEYNPEAININDSINKGLNQVPEFILTRFNDEGWKIKVEPLLQTIPYKGVEFAAAGSTNYNTKVITLEANARIATETLTHEFGHYFDYINNRISLTEEWTMLYKTEWKGLYLLNRSFHNVDCPQEFFAEIFSWYLEKPELVQKSCPRSFEAMDTLINNISK